MSAITFTNENIIALNKLEMSLRRATGVRYSLSEESSRFKLIKHASINGAIRVEAAFLEFIQGLSNDQKTQLLERGISFDRPTPLEKERQKMAQAQKSLKPAAKATANKVTSAKAVSSKAAASKAAVSKTTKTKAAATAATRVTPIKKAAKPATTPKTPAAHQAKRIYRGQAVAQ